MTAELILCTGRCSLAFLRDASRKSSETGGATPPADEGQRRRRQVGLTARYNLRHAWFLHRKVTNGKSTVDDFCPCQSRLSHDLCSGELARKRDEAARARGRERMRDEDGSEILLGFRNSLASQIFNEKCEAEDGVARACAECLLYYNTDIGRASWARAAPLLRRGVSDATALLSSLGTSHLTFPELLGPRRI